MRWLWRAEPGGGRPEKADPRGVFEVLVKEEGWKRVYGQGAQAIVADAKGTIYFMQDGILRRLENDHAETVVFIPDEYHEIPWQTRQYGDAIKIEELAVLYHAALNNAGDAYYIKQGPHDILMRGGSSALVCVKHQGASAKLNLGTSILDHLVFTPDQGFLIVVNEYSFQLRSFRVEKDGSLTNEEPFYSLLSLEGQNRSGATAAAFDDKGRLYVSSVNGIQIFDQGGRVIGILTLPENHAVNGMAFGGPNFDTLYVTTDKAVYARKLNARGVRSCDPPVAPPPPRM
jgi:hypothetical protein